MKLSSHAAGLGLSGTLVSLFIICAVVQVALPSLQATHAWINLFTNAPAGSGAMWIQGIIANAVAGYIAGIIFSKIYNAALK